MATEAAKRIVVKIGTNTLCDHRGEPEPGFMEDIADELVELARRGHEVLIVTSGAIGVGKGVLGVPGSVQDIHLRQALAAAGQPHLMKLWADAFGRREVRVAQLLLTQHAFTSRKAFLNLRNTTEKLLELGVVPIINENDTVSIDEIDASFGDNDRLSAYVAAKTGADLLVILSNVAGLYSRPPDVPGAELVPVVDELTDEVMRMAAYKPGSGGRGGMQSKLEAAKVATRGGTQVVIAHGREPQVVSRILAGESVGTRFLPRGRLRSKEKWLEIARPAGRVHVDEGAAKALWAGRHLLPAGVVRVEGSFSRGSVIEICHAERVIAKAVTQFAAKELEAAQGKRSGEVKALLDLKGAANITRKNNVVVLERE